MNKQCLDPALNCSTLVDLLHWRALYQANQPAFTFLLDGDTQQLCLTCGELDRRARAIAAQLQSRQAAGQRALLLYLPSLDYIASFLACLYAGVVAVPVYPPDPARLNRTLPRLQAIVADAQVSHMLTTSPILAMAQQFYEIVLLEPKPSQNFEQENSALRLPGSLPGGVLGVKCATANTNSKNHPGVVNQAACRAVGTRACRD